MPIDRENRVLTPGFYWVVASTPAYVVNAKFNSQQSPRLWRTFSTQENKAADETFAVIEVLQDIDADSMLGMFRAFDELPISEGTQESLATIDARNIGVWAQPGESAIHVASELISDAGKTARAAKREAKTILTAGSQVAVAVAVVASVGGLIWLAHTVKK